MVGGEMLSAEHEYMTNKLLLPDSNCASSSTHLRLSSPPSRHSSHVAENSNRRQTDLDGSGQSCHDVSW